MTRLNVSFMLQNFSQCWKRLIWPAIRPFRRTRFKYCRLGYVQISQSQHWIAIRLANHSAGLQSGEDFWWWQNGKTVRQRLASVGIKRVPNWWLPWNPFNISTIESRGLRGPTIGPHYAERVSDWVRYCLSPSIEIAVHVENLFSILQILLKTAGRNPQF